MMLWRCWLILFVLTLSALSAEGSGSYLDWFLGLDERDVRSSAVEKEGLVCDLVKFDNAQMILIHVKWPS
jgi:hypothetical protein